MEKTTNRRRFIQLTGGALGSLALISPTVFGSQKTSHG